MHDFMAPSVWQPPHSAHLLTPAVVTVFHVQTRAIASIIDFVFWYLLRHPPATQAEQAPQRARKLKQDGQTHAAQSQAEGEEARTTRGNGQARRGLRPKGHGGSGDAARVRFEELPTTYEPETQQEEEDEDEDDEDEEEQGGVEEEEDKGQGDQGEAELQERVRHRNARTTRESAGSPALRKTLNRCLCDTMRVLLSLTNENST